MVTEYHENEWEIGSVTTSGQPEEDRCWDPHIRDVEEYNTRTRFLAPLRSWIQGWLAGAGYMMGQSSVQQHQTYTGPIPYMPCATNEEAARNRAAMFGSFVISTAVSALCCYLISVTSMTFPPPMVIGTMASYILKVKDKDKEGRPLYKNDRNGPMIYLLFA